MAVGSKDNKHQKRERNENLKYVCFIFLFIKHISVKTDQGINYNYAYDLCSCMSLYSSALKHKTSKKSRKMKPRCMIYK